MDRNEYLGMEHKKAGLCLEEDQYFVYLRYRNHTIMTWHVTKVTLEKVVESADAWLATNRA